MKKLMSVMLGLTFVLGTATMFAQDTATKDTNAPKKEKKAKKMKTKKTTEEKK